jgi:hypothetical protein
MHENPAADESYISVLREVGGSAKELLKSELALIKAEIEEKAQAIGRHSVKAGVFIALLAISVLPFLAFLVIGLGELLDHRYWLSSLIVAVGCATVGGTFAYSYLKQIKEKDLKLPLTRGTLEIEKNVVKKKVDDLKQATMGELQNGNA